MYFSEIKKLDSQYIANTYVRNDLDVQSGSGAACFDGAGKRFVDFSSGIGVNSGGFANPKWVNAVKQQIDALAHMSNLFYTMPQIKLAKALCERTGMRRVFFANSGAEANEGAIKTARKYGCDKYGSERHEIITLENSFHGRTIATLAATGQDVFHKNFGPFPEGFVYAQANDLDDIKAKISEKTCAVMIECIQGEGGVVPLAPEFVTGIATICAEKDILLVVDEIQTGMGRTGKLMCYEHFGIKPDVVTLAKGLGGGLPIGAVLFSGKTMDTLGLGDHGSTFGGNPVSCAGAVEIMNMIDGRFLDTVSEKGAYITEKLLAVDGVTGVSGKGMMIGVELEKDLISGDIVKAAIAEGLILLTAKSKVRLLPPLCITYGEIDEGLDMFRKAVAGEKRKVEAAKKAENTPKE